MKYGRMAILICAIASTPAMATTWRAFGDEMAGGTVEVWFSAVPPGGGAGVGPYSAVIAGVPATRTGIAAVTPGAPGNTVTFTVTGNTWFAIWTITHTFPGAPGINIARVRIKLATTMPVRSMFDSPWVPPLPSTPVSRRGRNYTFVAGGGFGADPQSGAGLYGVPSLAKPGNIGDLFDELDLLFAAAGNLFINTRTLSFKADTDKLSSPGYPPPPCLVSDDDFEECEIAEPNGACCGFEGGCFEADDQAECEDSGFGQYRGDGTTCEEECPEPVIPTVSEWGLIVMALLGLTAGTIVFGRRRRSTVA